MLSFKQYLDEQAAGWTRSRGTDEHDEVHYQLDAHKNGQIHLPDHVHKQLIHLSNKDNFKTALSNSKRETYTAHKVRTNNTQNTDAGVRNKQGPKFHVDAEKRKRVESNKSAQKSPIILRHKESGHEHLLGGNTRMSLNHTSKAHVIEY